MVGKTRGRRELEGNSSLGDLADRRKFDEFVNRSYKSLCALAYQILGEWNDAHDAVQNALLELWEIVVKRLQKPDANAFSVACQLVGLRASDILRERSRMTDKPPENPPSDDGASDTESDETPQFPDERDVEGIVIALEKRKDIQRCGQELKGRAREVFLLLMEGCSQSEIAKRLGVSQARVSQLVKEICFKLRQKLREEGWECDETIGVPLRF